MFKVGDKVKVVGREGWHDGRWDMWLKVVGTTFIVTEVTPYVISGLINGISWGFMPDSLKLIDNQLMFSFMYEED